MKLIKSSYEIAPKQYKNRLQKVLQDKTIQGYITKCDIGLGVTNTSRGEWTITHLESGYILFRFSTKKKVVEFLKQVKNSDIDCKLDKEYMYTKVNELKNIRDNVNNDMNL